MSDGRKEPATARMEGEAFDAHKPDPPPAPPLDSYRTAYERDSAEWVAARSLERIADRLDRLTASHVEFVAWCKQRW